jgi:hypothetical protein
MAYSSDQRAALNETVFEQPSDDLVITDTHTIFQLIDQVLPFEVCLHYQLLPLSLKNNSLALGMIDLEDTTALDYVGRLLMSRQCSIAPQLITLDVHRAVLSAYLKNSEQVKNQAAERDRRPPTTPPSGSQESLDSTATVILETSKQPNNVRTGPAASSGAAHKRTIPALEIWARHFNEPLESLGWLRANELLSELLARVLQGGIGRLYLERGEYTHRIIVSQNGTSQSSLPRVPINVFEGVLNELKQMAGLSLEPIEQTKGVNLERMYQGENVLLRLRFAIGTYGEQATLQVLRGKASKFYEKQKLTKLGTDALTLVQQLQTKLNDIHSVYLVNPNLSDQPAQELEPLYEALMQLERDLGNPLFSKLFKSKRNEGN